MYLFFVAHSTTNERTSRNGGMGVEFNGVYFDGMMNLVKKRGTPGIGEMGVEFTRVYFDGMINLVKSVNLDTRKL